MAFTKRGSAAYEAERALRTIFRRCLECEDKTLTCPPCASNQICSLISRDCNSCDHMECVANPSYTPPPSSGPNVGAIAGGVVGGIALVGIVVFLVWFYWIRKRRAQQEAEAEEWEEDEIAKQKVAFQSMLHDAASTRTRGSLANSILSRASNVIQIAFIPGVTTRNGSSQNSVHAATPVPPIPAARGTPRSPLTTSDDAIFFRPGDIRDSSYSGHSSVSLDRRDTQYSFDSRASSIPHSVYHDSLTIQPATQAARGMARMVSVKPSPLSTPTEGHDTTPLSGSDYSQFSANLPGTLGKPVQIMMPAQGQRGPLQSQGSFGKAHQITLGGGKGKGRFPVRTAVDAASASEGNARHVPAVASPLRDANNDTDEEEEEEHARARKSLLKISPRSGQQTSQSPFTDEAVNIQTATRTNPYSSMSSNVGTLSAAKRGKSMGGLSAVIEEATRRASNSPDHEGLGGKRDSSPFSDSNKVD